MAQRILNSYRDINYSKASNAKMQINSYVARALGVITLPRYPPSQWPGLRNGFSQLTAQPQEARRLLFPRW